MDQSSEAGGVSRGRLGPILLLTKDAVLRVEGVADLLAGRFYRLGWAADPSFSIHILPC